MCAVHHWVTHGYATYTTMLATQHYLGAVAIGYPWVCNIGDSYICIHLTHIIMLMALLDMDEILTPKGITLDCGRDIILIIKTTQTREEINLIGFEKHFR